MRSRFPKLTALWPFPPDAILSTVLVHVRAKITASAQDCNGQTREFLVRIEQAAAIAERAEG